MSEALAVKPGNGGGIAAKAGVVANDAQTGRFVPTAGLTQMQSAYVTAFLANGGIQRAAAKTAGYAAPDAAGWQLSRHPAIVAEIRNRQIAAMGGLAVVAVNTLRSVMEDETAPAAARVQASRFALEAAGFGIQAEALKLRFAGLGNERDISAMSIAELQELALMVKGEVDTIALRDGRPITPDSAPIADTDRAQAIEA